jgi:PBP1b-binding outer membrane lipoprotein LpoB
MPRPVRVDTHNIDGKKQPDLLWQKRVYRKDYNRDLDRLFNLLGKIASNSGSRKTSYTASRTSKRALSFDQLCMVKCRYGKDKNTHKKFLEEYLTQLNKEHVINKPVLFTDSAVDDAFINQYKDSTTGLHYKFIISPESQEVDTEALVKTLVKRMEAATGYKFNWVAATHTDTPHKHAHLLINGVDKNGKEVQLDKVFKTHTVRELSRSICTSLIGQRTVDDIKTSIEKSYSKCSYVALDDSLREREIPISSHPAYESRVSVTDALLLKRLNFLCDIGLAAREPELKKTFLLEKGWKNKLKAMGRYNSFLDARNSLRTVSNTELELYSKETGTIEGIITKLYRMNDEDSWNHAVLIENKKLNKAWYVRLHFSPDQKLLNSYVKCGFKFNSSGNMVPKITVTRWASPHSRTSSRK